MRCSLTLAIVVFIGTCAARGEPVYTQYYSDRLLFSHPPANSPPWPQLPLEGAKQVAVSPTDPQRAWVVDSKGDLWTVDGEGQAERLQFLSTAVAALDVDTTAHAAVTLSTTGLVQFWTCRSDSDCQRMATGQMGAGLTHGIVRWFNSQTAYLVVGEVGWKARVVGAAVTVERVGGLPAHVSSVATHEGVYVAFGAATGVWYSRNGGVTYEYEFQGATVEEAVHAVAFTHAVVNDGLSGEGTAAARLWVACNSDGLNYVTLEQGTGLALHAMLRWGGTQGLPLANVTMLTHWHFPQGTERLEERRDYDASSSSALLACTHGQGCALLDDATRNPTAGAFEGASSPPLWRVFAGARWLSGDTVLSGDCFNGTAWVLTTSGLSRLHKRLETVSAKNEHYEKQVYPRHNRFGLVAPVPLARFGDLASYTPSDGDNDGGFTCYYITAQTMRLRVTHNESIVAATWPHINAVEFLHNVTTVPGLVARTVVKCGTPHGTGDVPDGWHNSSVCFNGVDAPGATDCCWTWKADTSSDEITTHVLGLADAHDHLTRTPNERRRLATALCRMVAYITDNGFRLIDISGNRTTWGYWDPPTLNGDPSASDERGINSLEMLAYLAQAERVCGADATLPRPRNESFGGAFARLALDHGYMQNLVRALTTTPGDIAYFDHRLAFDSYALLFGALDVLSAAQLHLTDAQLSQLRSAARFSLDTYYAGVASEHSYLWASVYALITRSHTPQQRTQALWSYTRHPTSLIEWPARNSHRLDHTTDGDYVRCCNALHSTTPVAPDESGHIRWDKDPFTLDGGSGLNEDSPSLFLIGYYTMLLAGFL